VTAFPDVTVRNRSKSDKFIILACDGIWDCLNNDECTDKIWKKLKKLKPSKTNICLPVEEIFDEILAPKT
jgi:serine/threonine protein phosphatase PrpC